MICGDLNLTLNPELDCFNYTSLNNPRARNVVLNIIHDFGLVDLYRYFHPDEKRYTWRRRNPLKQSRLDYFLVSSSLTDLVDKIDIKPGYKSDHSMIHLDLTISKFKMGKGTWKFNTRLLKDNDYLILIKKCIQEEYQRYATPVYDPQYIKSETYDNITLTIDYDLFLEAILLRLRGETIKFACRKKKQEKELENKLCNEIENFEKEPLGILNTNIDEKRKELEQLRESKTKGQLIRSRVQWLIDGEKPSKYFCSLEHQNYINKTVKRLKCNDGSDITNQKEILTELAKYYEKRFQSQDHRLGTAI